MSQKKSLPAPAATWTERSRRQLERALPWLSTSVELEERITQARAWVQAEAEDIASRGDGVTAPGIVAMLNEAAVNLAHAEEVRLVAMRCRKRGDDAKYVKYIAAAAKLGDAAGLHITRARAIAHATKAKAAWVDPTDAYMSDTAGLLVENSALNVTSERPGSRARESKVTLEHQLPGSKSTDGQAITVVSGRGGTDDEGRGG